MEIFFFLRKLREKNIDISLFENDLKISSDIEITPELVKEIKLYKKRIIAYLKENLNDCSAIAIRKIATNASYPLSSSQKRLWMLCQTLEANIAYNIPGVHIFEGDLDIQSFEHSFKNLIERYEILRTVFHQNELGEVEQKICSPNDLVFRISIEDTRNEKEQEILVKSLVFNELNKAFNLESGPLIRVTLIRVGANKWIFVYVMHHIISDGWSMGILFKELLFFYSAHRNGLPIYLPPLNIQYKEYAVWQQELLKTEKMKAHEAYWLKQFAGDLPVLELLGDKARPITKTYNGGAVRRRLDHNTSFEIKRLSREEGGTLFMGLLSAVNALLFRYTDQEDIIVGTVIAGREHADLENQIGFFVNTLPLRIVFNGKSDFRSLLKTVIQVTLSAYEHQIYPFDEMVDKLRIPRDASRSVLFDVMVVLQNNEVNDLKNQRSLEDVKAYGYGAVGNSVSKFDITFNFAEAGEEINLSIGYNSDIYNKHSIELLADHFNRLLYEAINNPSIGIHQLDYLSESEKNTLLKGGNEIGSSYPKDKTIVDLFESQVLETPDNVAVVYEQSTLTYRELNERANQLGHYLRKVGVKEDMLIPVCLDRGIDMIVALLGILKSGGAYVPIDPSYPQDRITFMIEDSGSHVVLTNNEFQSLVKEFEGRTIVSLDVAWADISQEPTSRVLSILHPHSLAYIIYTSGSTGRPKGVMIDHLNVIQLFEAENRLFDFNSSDVWTMFHSFCFDFSVWEMYGALFYGGRLIIVPKVVAQDSLLFGELLLRHKVTILNQTPSAFFSFQDQSHSGNFSSLRYVIFGGEALNISRLRSWKQQYKNCKMINMYGITETTVHVTYHEIIEKDLEVGKSIIGRPIPTLKAYVLDRNKKLKAVGIPGELYVSGPGVSRGYLNQPTLTVERFVPDPFSMDSGSLMYRTGDQVRWLEDGTLEFLSRLDQQVKINGYRIELGEIEEVLRKYQGLNDCVVVMKTINNCDSKLFVYFTSSESISTLKLRKFLIKKLPAYSIPSSFIQLDAIPLTSSGKIDRKYLESLPVGNGLFYKEFVEPQNDLEIEIAGIWKEILFVDKIGRGDDFFDLGGSSILVMKAIAQIQIKIGVKLRITDFINQSLEQIAQKCNI